MLKLITFAIVALLNYNLLIACSMVLPDKNSVEEEFNSKYLKWKEYISQPVVKIQSTAKGRIENPFFAAIVDIGPAALPFIADKIEQDPEADVLWHAIEKIAKINIKGVYDKITNKIIFPDSGTKPHRFS